MPHFSVKDIEELYNERISGIAQNAPVDSTGASSLYKNTNDFKDKKEERFHYFFKVLLSSQTKDETTHRCYTEFINKHGILNVQQIQAIDIYQLQQSIRICNFYMKKAAALKNNSNVLINKYGGDMPTTTNELEELELIGTKSANLINHLCWGSATGISVDTHVHKIANRIGWVKTNNPIQTQRRLQEVVPRKLWGDVNWILVGYGQLVCKTKKPLCEKCPLKYKCEFALKIIKI